MNLYRLADHTNPASYVSRLRRERMKWFIPLVEACAEPVRILDIGGTASFWKHNVPELPRKCQLTLLNMDLEDVAGLPDAVALKGDARNLSMFGDRAFDICFSNSVIEHVGTLFDQLAMAREIRRVGRSYFVETPNRYFPLEPHFLFPGWPFLPLWVRAFLLNHFKVGWWPRRKDPFLARAEVEQIRLLTFREMRYLFPEAEIRREKMGPLTKALVATGRLRE
jgi:hypothetical protein